MDATRAETATWPWVALRMIPGVGVGLYHELLRRFGNPGVVLGASRSALAAAGVPPQAARAITAEVSRREAERDVEAAAAAGARIVTWAAPDYPALLRHVHDPPPYLYVRGHLPLQEELAVAIVGSRAASTYGRETATMLAHDLAAAGVTVVSGLAHGIDGAAHRGALAGGGRTIAVLGCGVDVIYPREHGTLAAAIAAQGTVMSEFSMGMPPRAAHFPMRNRIISGLARGTIVVEATDRSGSLITARLALEQGREVFAVPGPITAARSRGTHRLIREGARLVTGADDVLEELGLRSPSAHAGPTPRRSGNSVPPPGPTAGTGAAQGIVAALGDGISDVDGLVARSGLTPQEVLRILLELELSGIVQQLPGVTFGLQRQDAGSGAVRWGGC